jgi:hypothetical protein
VAQPQFFSDLDNPSSFSNKKPFFAIDLTKDAEVFTWLKDELAHLQHDGTERLEKIKNNYMRYKGIQYLQQVYLPRDMPDTRKRYMPQVTVPLIRNVTDEIVSRLLEFKPSVAVMPINDEEGDKVDAKIAKRFLSHVDYNDKLDQKILTWCRDSKIAGEAYIWPNWNPDIGDVLNEDQIGATPVCIGDISNRNMSVFNTFYQKVRRFEDVDYVFYVTYEYTEGLKRDYPDKESIIKSDNVRYYDTEKMTDETLEGFSYKFHFYYRPTKYLPTGFEACFTELGILKSGPFPFRHKKLPMIRLVDQQNPEELHGESSMEYTRGIAAQFNNMTNLIIKQQMLCAHPKWFYEAASLDEQLLGNDTNIVKLKPGSKAPVLAQGAPVSQQVFDFREKLKEEFYSMSKSNSVVQGEPPQGVTAFVALQFVSESESRRMSTDVQVLNAAIRDLYDMDLKLAAQFYKPEDERTMMLLGPDGKWLTKSYNPKSLQGPFAVMVQNQTALPESRAVRTQFVLDMSERYPGLLPKEQVIEMLGLGQSEKFMDLGSAAARAAEEEQEIILDQGQQIEPAEWEDHITHWKIHTMKIQDIGFKTATSPESQEMMKDHILATEMLMIEQAKRSPQLTQLLLMLPNFPIFYVDSQAQMAAGMLTGTIPAVMQGAQGAMQAMSPPMPEEPQPGAQGKPMNSSPSDISQGVGSEPTPAGAKPTTA